MGESSAEVYSFSLRPSATKRAIPAPSTGFESLRIGGPAATCHPPTPQLDPTPSAR